MSVSPREVDRRVKAFEAVCREQGLRVTPQRTAVYRELAASAEHPDVETIHTRVARRMPSVSLDTVYRTLVTLEELGLIRRVEVLHQRARFDANTDRHHHFVCTRCGLVRDLYDPAFDAVAPSGDLGDVGAVESVHVQVRGVCRACRTKRRKA